MTANEQATATRPRVLLTGASGYVGGRLLQHLERRDITLRCMARRPEFVRAKLAKSTELVRGDAFDPASLTTALEGIDTAYYLIHSMGSLGDFEEQDRIAAKNFSAAARHAGVRRIIYLGGLGVESPELSPHLRSRQEVGDLLRESGCEVIEFRASIVIGSGSLSFELVRSLVEKLPVMICPRWVSTEAQPIAIEDLLLYLEAALERPAEGSHIFEVGGPDRATYGEIMKEYAKQRGLKRLLISVPVLTPRLSSLWLGLVTPVYARIGRKLVESMRNPTVVHNQSAEACFGLKPRSLEAAIGRALAHEDHEFATTRWSDAASASLGIKTWGGVQFGPRVMDSRRIELPLPPKDAFRPVQEIGGSRGWYFANWLWTLRGWIDLLCGGIGRRRGRRDPQHVAVGDTIDWWRVEQYVPGHLLRLTAEMKVPGRAWLQFEATATERGTELHQLAIFDPVGILGRLYWYSLYPLHAIIFHCMLTQIGRRAMADARCEPSSDSKPVDPLKKSA
ncbi:MAG: SDR family oxidoreductase [Planctomycetota bacterium]|nr:SDR family oxidoreductase [Planctomycetota bacterium]